MFKFRSVITSLAVFASLTVMFENMAQSQMMGRFRGRTNFVNRISTTPLIGTPRIGNLFSGSMMSNRYNAPMLGGDMSNTMDSTWSSMNQFPTNAIPNVPTPAQPTNWTPTAPSYSPDNILPGNILPGTTGPAPIIVPAPMNIPGNSGTMIMPGCGCGSMQSAMTIQPVPAMNGNYITIPAGPTMAPRAEPSEYVQRLFRQLNPEPKSVLDAPPLLDGGK